jgi:hypothetical protein
MYEFDNTMAFFQGSSFVNPIEDALQQYVIPTILKMLIGHYRSTQVMLTKDEVKTNTIPFKKIAQALKNTAGLIKVCKASNSNDALEKVFVYCEQLGYVVKETREESKYAPKSRAKGVYDANDYFRLTASFKAMLNEG